MPHRPNLALTAALFGVLVLPAPAAAQAASEGGRAELVRRLADCRKQTDDAQRLACYDAAAAALDQAEAKGDIVVVDREQARQVRRQAFGFSLPSISILEKGAAKEDLEAVASRIVSARADMSGTWTQIDVTPVNRTPKAGLEVTIKKGSLGSFMMSIAGQRVIRVKRVE